jgi:hypothetical protein
MIQQHRVTLSNGKSIIILEEREAITIATADQTGEPDAYIATLRDTCVLTYCNSGDATGWLLQGIKSK